MSGVRHLKELSARVATQGGMDRCASSAGRQSDGDDSRQHSPDKQAKHGSPGRPAALKTVSKSGQLSSSRPSLPQTVQKPQRQQLQPAGHPVAKPAVREAAARQSAAGLAPVRQSQARAPTRPVQGQSMSGKHPAVTQQSSGTPAACIPPAVQLTGRSAAPAQTPLQAQPSHSSTCQNVSTESSCSSVISPREQLLLAAAIEQLHNQTQYPQQQRSADSSGGSSQSSQQQGNTAVPQQQQAQLLPRQPSGLCQQQRPSSARGPKPALAADPASSCRDATATAAVLAAMNRGAESVLQPQTLAAASGVQQEQLAAAPIPSGQHLEAPQQAGDCTGAADGISSASVQQLQQQGVHTSTSAAAPSAFAAGTDQVVRSCSAWDLPSQLVSRDISEVLLSGKGSLTASEFEAATQDVAARIIQTHWHLYMQRRLQQQEEQQMQQLQQQQEAQPQQQEQDHGDVQQQTLRQEEEQPATCSDGPSTQTVSAAYAAATGDSGSSSSLSSECASRSQALVPQVSAAALGKLRASAGSRNAARLQQCRQVGASAAFSQQMQPGLLAQAVTPVCCGSVDSQQVLSQQGAQFSLHAAEETLPAAAAAAACVAAAGSSTGAAQVAFEGTNDSHGDEQQHKQQELQQQEQQQRQQPQQESGVAGAGKLSAILAYLDAVEASVETEGAPKGTQLRPGTSCLPSASNSHTGINTARPLTAHPTSSFVPWHPQPQQQQQQQQQHELQPVLMWDGAVLQQVGSSMASGWADVAEAATQSSSLGTGASAAFPVTSGVGTTQHTPLGASNRPAALAESVFGGVKSKMQNLKAALAAKEDMLQSMAQEIQSLRESHQQQLQQQAAALQQQLAVVATESSASLSRHMGLIDKLMDEKGMLASRLDNAQKAAVAAEERHAAAVAALKQGWAAELKRQAANWEASAAAKQEAWRTAKVSEIKEQTVKGLEVEVQRLINRHKADLEAAHAKADEQVKLALEGAKAKHEEQMQALRDRLRQQQDEVVESERAAAASRLCEASERWEAQLQASRMRLAADNDMKLEAAAAVAREEKRKGEAALEAAEARHAAREALLKEEWDRKKEALARKHMRAIEAAKQAAADERTAWRAAVTEKLKRQATEREDKLRAELLKQRDEQLEVVIRRLEAEGAASRAAAADKVAAEHAAAMTALQEQLQQSQKGAKRLAERGKAAAAAAAAAERQKLELEQQLEQARQELTSQQGALATARATLSAKESEAATAAAAAAASVASSVGALQGDKARLEGRLQEAQEQLRQARQQHEVEMQHLEHRVKAAVARKDEAIQQLQQQLAAALEALRGTEGVLAAQQEELYD